MNEKQLMLYYGIGKYISLNSRNGFWGKGAIDAISEQLDKELPGLRGFTSRNLRYMRTFYEEWKILDFAEHSEKITENPSTNLELTNSKTQKNLDESIWNLQVPNYQDFPIDAFLHIGFTHHRVILGKIKNLDERLFYIKRCAEEHFTVDALKNSLAADDYHHQGSLPNNFVRTLPAGQQALKANGIFKMQSARVAGFIHLTNDQAEIMIFVRYVFGKTDHIQDEEIVRDIIQRLEIETEE